MNQGKPFDLCIIGGAGHVGLTNGLVFASRGLRVLLCDINQEALDGINNGVMPFQEEGAEETLKEVLLQGKLAVTSNAENIAGVSAVMIAIGTPVDEFLNPDFKVVRDCVDQLLPYLSDKQLLILRSTVYPGTTDWLENYLISHGKNNCVAYCPERAVQGKAIDEIKSLPQLVAGITPEAQRRATELFSMVVSEIIALKPVEAEFAKLLNNAYRYIEFAIANEFFMMVNSAGVDYQRVLEGMSKNYPRAKHLPKPGFAAGPCLFKDTMQLTAFSSNKFTLGNSAMLVNEGLVLYIVNQINTQWHHLPGLKIGLLGMSFKADIDDIRSSLSYKLKKTLESRGYEVLTTDPHVTVDRKILPLQEVIDRSDLLILCVPHSAYRGIDLKGKPVVDVSCFFGEAKTEPASTAPVALPVAVIG